MPCSTSRTSAQRVWSLDRVSLAFTTLTKPGSCELLATLLDEVLMRRSGCACQRPHSRFLSEWGRWCWLPRFSTGSWAGHRRRSPISLASDCSHGLRAKTLGGLGSGHTCLSLKMLKTELSRSRFLETVQAVDENEKASPHLMSQTKTHKHTRRQ